MGIAGASLVEVRCIATVTFFFLTHAEIAGVLTESKAAILHIHILFWQLHVLFTYYAS